jgi:phosphatidylglycerophosphate synthase
VTAGQAWTREVLRELRAQRYRPRAWAGFLASSFARARATRAERRREHRQTLLLGAAGLTAWAAVAGVRPWPAAVGAVWWLLVIAMVDWHLGMLQDDSGRPLRRLGLPNLLSIGRAAVVPVLLVAPPALLASILIPAGVTDGVDGPLARARGEETRLGVWLDGGVDALVLSAAAVGAARHDLLPWWAAALVLARHAAQWLVVALAYLVRAAPPTRSGLVSGKAPGLILFAGLALAALRLPGAAPLVSVGALGGLTTFGVTLVRARGLQPAS